MQRLFWIVVFVFLVPLTFGQTLRQSKHNQTNVGNYTIMLRSPSKKTRSLAIQKIKAVGKSALPYLEKSLHSSNLYECNGAATILSQMGRDAIPLLSATLKDQDVYVRTISVWALGAITDEPRMVLPLLKSALKDSNSQVRTSAVFALGGTLKEPNTIFPALISVLQDRDYNVRQSAIYFLYVRGKQSMPFLIQATKSNDVLISEGAKVAIERYNAPRQK